MTGLHAAPRARRRRWPLVLSALVVALLLAMSSVALVMQRQFDPPGPDGAAVVVDIPRGSSTARIASLLASKGVVKSARAFRVYVRLKGAGPFLAGRYTLHRSQAFAGVIRTLGRGPEIVYDRLTIPEGLTIGQIAERVGKLPGRSAEQFMEAASSGRVRSAYQPAGVTTLEGLLFPDTYLVESDDTEEEILKRMVASLETVGAEVGIDHAEERVGVSPYEAIVVASLVEREARVDDDRRPVSSVVYNRLAKDMLLQIDATVLYALGEHKTRVLFRDLEVDSPYNTYKVKGLPPTPIAAPGRAALRAAVEPANTDYLYYVVVDASGRHAFGRTGAEHQANIRRAEKAGVR